jgi:hypothetical protein
VERKIIESTVASLPISALGEIQADHEIWEEDDGGARFKVTKHILPLPNGDTEIIALSVSGEPHERARVVREFSEVLGLPDQIAGDPRDIQGIDFMIWVSDDFRWPDTPGFDS